MQTGHQHATGIAAQLDSRVSRAEQVNQLIVNDFDNLLPGLNALDHFLAQGLGFDALNEIARDLEIDIGFQQCQPHLTQSIADVFLRNFAQPTQVLEGVLELAA